MNPKESLGILICLLATLIFAGQDAITKALTSTMPAPQFIMIRFWAFLLFALLFAHFNGGLKKACKSKKPFIQIVRGLLLIIQIIIFAFGLKLLSLADMHSLFVIYPIFVTLLAALFLNERIGWRSMVAVLVSFIGALLILRPGMGIFGLEALFPISCALLFAIYNVLTRMTSYHDNYTSNIFYVAVTGALVSTAWGLPLWQTPNPTETVFIAGLCFFGVAGHVLLMKALEYASASTIQPFNYFTLVWAIIISVIFFNEWPDQWTMAGAATIILSGLFVLRRSNIRNSLRTGS